jgi:hypothetical protein
MPSIMLNPKISLLLVQCLSILLSAGASVDIPDKTGETPIQMSNTCGHHSAADLLSHHLSRTSLSNTRTSLTSAENLAESSSLLSVSNVIPKIPEYALNVQCIGQENNRLRPLLESSSKSKKAMDTLAALAYFDCRMRCYESHFELCITSTHEHEARKIRIPWVLCTATFVNPTTHEENNVSIVDDKSGISSAPSAPLSHSFLPGGSESTQAKIKRLELTVKMECGPESGDEGAPTRLWHSVLSLLFVHREDCEAVLERINTIQTLQKTIAQVP